MKARHSACGAIASWRERGGGGGGAAFCPGPKQDVCSTPLAPLPQAGAQALSYGAPHLVTIL